VLKSRRAEAGWPRLAITQSVEKSVSMGLSLDKVRDFSRHKGIQTLMTYRDSLTNEQGNLANAVASTALDFASAKADACE